MTIAEAPPVLDFSSFYGSEEKAKTELIETIRDCCLRNGFFQITGHNVPAKLQKSMLECTKQLFALPQEYKDAVLKDKNTWNRGYEKIGSQILEVGTAPELKEGYYIGEDLSTDHPYFVNKRLNSGPNVWPENMPNVGEFKETATTYYKAMHALARDVLAAIAQTLDLEPTYFQEFTKDAIATLRLLHYPPQAPDSDEKLSRGIGAHTDFGSVTLLLQGEVDGLQVYEKSTDEWLDVKPIEGAYVVNLGNAFMRWSNDKYVSNLHRVINKSGQERYSIPFFYSGNPDYVIKCLPGCVGDGVKYEPITVEEAVRGAYLKSYGAAEVFKKEVGVAV
ncbi:hypothetical protein Vi05172_g12290 [Venturia inaequalis]|nr:hypothetical protein Vi05172_g12290 [Venturia inaequalis]